MVSRREERLKLLRVGELAEVQYRPFPTYILRFLLVPQYEELVEGPFNALNALLLHTKRLSVESWPVRIRRKVKQANVGQE